MPAALGLLVIASDFFGSLALALGLGGRLAAFGTAAVMLGAMVLVHGQYGFFINWYGFIDWYGAQQGEGIQFHLLATAAAVVVMAKGSGAWSLDRLLTRPSGGAMTSALPGPRALRAA